MRTWSLAWRRIWVYAFSVPFATSWSLVSFSLASMETYASQTHCRTRVESRRTAEKLGTRPFGKPGHSLTLTRLLLHMKHPDRVRRCLTGSMLDFLRFLCDDLGWLYIMGSA